MSCRSLPKVTQRIVKDSAEAGTLTPWLQGLCS